MFWIRFCLRSKMVRKDFDCEKTVIKLDSFCRDMSYEIVPLILPNDRSMCAVGINCTMQLEEQDNHSWLFVEIYFVMGCKTSWLSTRPSGMIKIVSMVIDFRLSHLRHTSWRTSFLYCTEIFSGKSLFSVSNCWNAFRHLFVLRSGFQIRGTQLILKLEHIFTLSTTFVPGIF